MSSSTPDTTKKRKRNPCERSQDCSKPNGHQYACNKELAVKKKANKEEEEPTELRHYLTARARTHKDWMNFPKHINEANDEEKIDVAKKAKGIHESYRRDDLTHQLPKMEKQLEQEKKEEKESSDKLFTQFKDDNIRVKVKTQMLPTLNEIVHLFSPAVAPLVVDAVIDYLKEKNDVLKLEFKYNQMNEFVTKTLKADTDKRKSELEEAIAEFKELLKTTRSQSPSYQEKLKPQIDEWEDELEAKESELQHLIDQAAGRYHTTYVEYKDNGVLPKSQLHRQQSLNQEIV